MRHHLAPAALFAALLVSPCAAAESSWIFQPSNYSHASETGERTSQFAAKSAAYAPSDPTYQRSGYLHSRTALRGAGGSIDRRHYVETWGAGEAIRPYGEWQRPFRAGATPYGPWGNPSGPWTSPYGSWVNPYGLGQLPNPPWSPWYPRPGYPHPGHPGTGHPGAGRPPHHGGGGPIATPYGAGGMRGPRGGGHSGPAGPTAGTSG